MTERQVTLGETTYRIAPFSNRKVLIAGRMMRKLSTTVSEINRHIAEFRNEYRERNREVVTRQMAAIPPWREILDFMTAEDWEKTGGQVELRRDPTDQEVIVEVFPLAFDLAEDEVKQLLALVIIPNQELGAAALAGNQTAKLGEYGDRILDDGTIGEMIELVDAAAAAIREELNAKAPAVGRLRALWKGRQTPANDEAQTTTNGGQPEEDSSKNAGSSTDSPARTDGDTTTSSTESRGAPASASAP
jgi:hypothetical protein